MLYAYASLFFDSLQSMILLIPHRAYVFEIMKIFGFYDQNLMIFLHVSAGMIGIIINWYMGYGLRNLIEPMGYVEKFKYYKYINKIMRSSAPALLLIFPSIASVIGASLGLYRTQLVRVLLIFLLTCGFLYYY
jgi:membrane protein YqaA with SNARE-associated domain